MKNAAYWSGRTIRETFDEHWDLDPLTGCHVWQRSRNATGYGQLNIGGRPMPAHRYAWHRQNGPIPKGMFVMHLCDHPACVRIDHLKLGTAAENVADMVRKGRCNNAGGWRCRKKSPRKLFTAQRFDDFHTLDSKTGCWNWNRALNEDGYGKVVSGGKKTGAHRFSWERANGQVIPKGMVIRHSCDNRACVNPAHLLLGTQADNIQDTVSRGRQSSGKGERAGNAKLTESAVREIRQRVRNGETRTAVARSFSISIAQAANIAARRAWAHVP